VLFLTTKGKGGGSGTVFLLFHDFLRILIYPNSMPDKSKLIKPAQYQSRQAPAKDDAIALASLTNTHEKRRGDDVLMAAYTSQLAYIYEKEFHKTPLSEKDEKVKKHALERLETMFGVTEEHMIKVPRPPNFGLIITSPDPRNPQTRGYAGTNPTELKDLLFDVNALPVITKNGHVTHRGFWKALQVPSGNVSYNITDQQQKPDGSRALLRDVKVSKHFETFGEEVERLADRALVDKSQRILYTGHSLGAAMATLAAADKAVIDPQKAPDEELKRIRNIELIPFSVPVTYAPIAMHLNKTIGKDNQSPWAHRDDVINKIGGNVTGGYSYTYDDKGTLRSEERTLTTSPPRAVTNFVENIFSLGNALDHHSLNPMVDCLEKKHAQCNPPKLAAVPVKDNFILPPNMKRLSDLPEVLPQAGRPLFDGPPPPTPQNNGPSNPRGGR
jgi:hypothetical protein